MKEMERREIERREKEQFDAMKLEQAVAEGQRRFEEAQEKELEE
jgi:hypothetical protein